MGVEQGVVKRAFGTLNDEGLIKCYFSVNTRNALSKEKRANEQEEKAFKHIEYFLFILA